MDCDIKNSGVLSILDVSMAVFVGKCYRRWA